MQRRVLIIEDDQSMAELERRHLDRGGFDSEIASSGDEAIAMIRDGGRFDVLIIDYKLPDMSGVELMQKVKEMQIDVPSVIVTAAGNEEIAVSAMKLGALDYIVKDMDTIKHLPDTCRDVIAKYDLASENKRLVDKLKDVNTELLDANKRLEEISRRDDLTGVYNRRYLMQCLRIEVARSKRYHSPLCLAIFDLDFFKTVNDNYGHIMGDLVLKQFADLMMVRLRKTDLFGRYGGEEFAVIITETMPDPSMYLCEELKEKVSGFTFGNEDYPIRLTCSAGVASYKSDMDMEQLIALADKSLYAAKERGRSLVIALELEEVQG